ncbi:YceI family protein [Pseudomonas sp. N3-W]|uniref:YceI family protein n=1 Tax=Pseudomonas sp. N3-W TaxID=2975049 RepID=UPI00217D5598|nr:YceI family protein [Pseudomonas sp. N3-W]UWF51557.1 YceI family protein [Pseudomonas sp. N3-W]
MKRRLPYFAPWMAAFIFCTAPCAHAVDYTRVNPAASQISFTFNQMGSRTYGTFGSFRGTLDFDTDRPAAAHASLSIDMASIDAGSSDADTELQKAAWFDPVTYPVGTFVSTRVQDLGHNSYLFTGNLTLKTITREVQVQVLLKPENGIGVFDGQFVLNRDAFGIGAGEWADTVVSKDINIRFRIVAPEH